jgi:hypothetical protein
MRNIGHQREGLPPQTEHIPGPLVQRQVCVGGAGELEMLRLPAWKAAVPRLLFAAQPDLSEAVPAPAAALDGVIASPAKPYISPTDPATHPGVPGTQLVSSWAGLSP